jgi:class 3 adenylate cyclase
VRPPDTKYAKSGPRHIAYQVVGEGPIDLLFVSEWLGHIDAQWEQPRIADFLEGLARFSRLILFNPRGMGASDPLASLEAPTAEEWVEDALAALAVALWYGVVPVLWLTQAEDGAGVAVLRDSLPDVALLATVWLLGETIRGGQELDRQRRALDAERKRSEQLLLNILPASIATRLKEARGPIADRYPDVSVLFADIVGFTRRSAGLPADLIVASLNNLVSEFDALARERGLEKIKTIGDAYMVAGGLPERCEGHVEALSDVALAMLNVVSGRQGPDGSPLEIRVGLDAGPVVAGVIGTDKFAWDIWGDTVNTASRIESTGVPGRIQTTDRVHARLRDRYRFEERGRINVKGKGELCTYFLVGPIGDDSL